MHKVINRKNISAALGVAAFSFVVAIIVSLGSEVVVKAVSGLALSFLFLLLVIIIGVFSDLVGVAATASTLAPFNAKAARKVFGAKQAVKLCKNADKVAVFCCDIIGDVCGTVAGAVGATIVLHLERHLHPTAGQAVLLGAAMTSLIAALSIGGKAFGKRVAIAEANSILFKVALVLAWWEEKTGLTILEKRR